MRVIWKGNIWVRGSFQPLSQPASSAQAKGQWNGHKPGELVLPLTSCVVLAKSLHLSEAQFFHKSGKKKSCKGFKKRRIHVKCLMQWWVHSRVKVKLRKTKLWALSHMQAPPGAPGNGPSNFFFFCNIRNHTIRNHTSFRFHRS